jgi:hypothetical protein
VSFAVRQQLGRAFAERSTEVLMGIRNLLRIVAPLGVALLGAVISPDPAFPHCDSMDGPVVEAARRALATNTVELALAWVQPSGDEEIRDAFARTMKVRAAGGETQALADLWFFETLVRVHRMGEGEPYTGLKPAGTEIPASIVQADHALETHSVEELAEDVADSASRALREKFAHVEELSDYDATDVAAGRTYVRAYTEYVHFVEALHALLAGEAEPHG